MDTDIAHLPQDDLPLEQQVAVPAPVVTWGNIPMPPYEYFARSSLLLKEDRQFLEAVLKSSGIDTIFPIHHDVANALAALR
jgi:hypothetical protein